MTSRWTRRAVLRIGASAAITSIAASACGDDRRAGGDAGPADGENGDDAASDAAPEDTLARPFYVLGHNPNTILEVSRALDAGANGIEPDINVYSAQPGQLCISHGEGDSNAPSLVQYLTELHAIALARPELALVVFDCKPGTVSPQSGAAILAAIRTHLTYDTNLNVIISVSALASAAMFDLIKDDLGPREGLMIDEENDPVAVSNHFAGIGVTNHGFGNGISILSCGLLGPNVRPSIEHACGMRASSARPRFIYVWTVDCVELEAEYIRIGADGVITDDPAEVRTVMARPEFADVVRLAVRADNPFAGARRAYALVIKTGDVGSGGTDANITFTLTGSLGSASKTVDTSYIRRMEQGDTNHVTIQAMDLGVLQSITVQRDDAGNAPGWYLESIQVSSARYGVSAGATFGGFIDDTAPHTLALI